MSRWLDREEKPENSADFSIENLSRGGAEKRERNAPAETEETAFGKNVRERVVVNNREYSIRPSEREALFELGRFRVVYESDVLRGVYSGNKDLAQADLRSLREEKLIYTVSFVAGRSGREKVYTLSSAGQSVLERVDPRVDDHAQRIYCGFVKPSEIEHDAMLYRAFQRETKRLGGEGARVKRVVLDYELKQKLFSRVERQRGRRPYGEVKAETARELALPTVNGRVMLPDLRIEYEDERGIEGRVTVGVIRGGERNNIIPSEVALSGTVR